MTKVKHSQSRTVQVRQYEPRTFTFEIEGEIEVEKLEAAMASMEKIISKKIDESVAQLQANLAQEKENS